MTNQTAEGTQQGVLVPRTSSEGIAELRALTTLVGLGATAMCLAMIAYARRGVDFLDEGYVLRLVSDPDSTLRVGEPYLWGFLLHPVWLLAGQDLVSYRVVSLIVVIAAGAALGYEVSRLMSTHKGVELAPATKLAIVAVAGASAGANLSFGVRVLGYNSLVLVGLAIVAISVLRLLTGGEDSWSVLAGIGGWVTFAAKPTSAAAALPLVLTTLLLSRQLTWRRAGLALVGATTAGALTLVIGGLTPAEAFRYISNGVHQNELLGSHKLTQSLGFETQPISALILLGPIILLPAVAAVLLLQSPSERRRRALPWLSMVLLLAAIVVAARMGSLGFGRLSAGREILPLTAVLPLAGLATLAASLRCARGLQKNSPQVVAPLFLLAIPYVAAVGTNSPFLWITARNSAFWVCALLAFSILLPAFRTSLLVALTFACGITGVLLYVDVSDGPGTYQLEDANDATRTRIGEVYLKPADAAVMASINDARTRGVTPSTPVADLTGLMHGPAFYLGGRPLGRAATFGAFPGSLAAARASFGTATCQERSRAWLLVDPDFSLSLASALLPSSIDLDVDYEKVAQFAATQSEARAVDLDVSILRPLPSAARKFACGD